MPDNDRWISMNEVCEYLGVSRQTILIWIKEKHLPAAKAGKFWRFKQVDIDEWMRQNNTDEDGAADVR